MKNKSVVWLSWGMVVAYASLIFYLSSQPRPLPDPMQKYLSDWFLHGVEYGVLGILLARAFGVSFHFRSWVALLFLTFVVGAAYGISDEWHQSFVPDRFPSAQDAAADAMGVFLGAVLWIQKNRKIFHA